MIRLYLGSSIIVLFFIIHPSFFCQDCDNLWLRLNERFWSVRSLPCRRWCARLSRYDRTPEPKGLASSWPTSASEVPSHPAWRIAEATCSPFAHCSRCRGKPRTALPVSFSPGELWPWWSRCSLRICLPTASRRGRERSLSEYRSGLLEYGPEIFIIYNHWTNFPPSFLIGKRWQIIPAIVLSHY